METIEMADKNIISNKAEPFVIKIFCADGDPNGLRIINKSNWSGQGLVCPRSLLPDYAKNCSEYKFDNPGVYVLVGRSNEEEEDDLDENDLPLIYVGEADPVGDRLLQHCVGEKDFWTWCVFFVGEDLNKAHIQHLEASLIELAKDANKVNLDNKNDPTYPNLSLSEKSIANGFLTQMLSIFPVVGLNAFQKADPPEDLLYIETCSGIRAEGYEAPDGFVVSEGSTATLQGSHSSIQGLKKVLNKDGILIANNDHYDFIKDYTFKTPARAASVILGFPAAKSAWKDKNGVSMKDLQKMRLGEKCIDPNES
jgi:hypothetical protein